MWFCKVKVEVSPSNITPDPTTPGFRTWNALLICPISISSFLPLKPYLSFHPLFFHLLTPFPFLSEERNCTQMGKPFQNGSFVNFMGI
jgi:hypothetical protein